jgi:Predicted nucleotide-binding protein containing TIR-like domain
MHVSNLVGSTHQSMVDTVLDALMDVLDSFDFGIFVLAPDDIIKIREKEFQSIRDNVVFELGMFIGKLSKERNFLVIPGDQQDFHLPTDLLGLTPATFEPEREDKNLNAALGPACNKIRKVIQNLGPIPKPSSYQSTEEKDLLDRLDENDIVSLIEAWMGSRPPRINVHVIKYSEVDKELNLPLGSAKKFIEVAANKWGY